MILSARLKKITDRIDEGETVVDIGTDHGFLPIYLLESGKSPRVIMTDISEQSLDKARENLMRLPEPARRAGSLRRGDGLDVVAPGEAHTCVIAGMGGNLMVEILSWDIAKTVSFKKLILQPRNALSVIREWLKINGFHIEHEDLVREADRICNIITVKFRIEKSKCDSEPKPENKIAKDPYRRKAEFEYPDMLKECENELLFEYIQAEITKHKGIVERIKSGKGDSFNELPKYREEKAMIERLKQFRTGEID